MSAAMYPTIGLSGWVVDPEVKIDMLLSDFYCSNVDQTNEFSESTASLPYLVKRNYTDTVALAASVRDAVQRYFGPYFDDVSSECNGSVDESGKGSIYLFIEVMQNGKTYSVAKSIVTNGSKIVSILDYNNG